MACGCAVASSVSTTRASTASSRHPRTTTSGRCCRVDCSIAERRSRQGRLVHFIRVTPAIANGCVESTPAPEPQGSPARRRARRSWRPPGSPPPPAPATALIPPCCAALGGNLRLAAHEAGARDVAALRGPARRAGLAPAPVRATGLTAHYRPPYSGDSWPHARHRPEPARAFPPTRRRGGTRCKSIAEPSWLLSALAASN